MIAFEPGDQYAGLRIEREIGRGAYGRVYLAEDPTIGRRVALKVLSALPGGKDAKRALREARMVGRIQSPNTVTLYRAIRLEEPQSWILEMEYVSGGSVSELLAQDDPIPLDRVLALARDIFRGLQAAHEAGVIHGDIKPGNVLLDASGTAKLADFGLGWALDETLATSSAAEALGGTPAYMAPEVIMGERARAASDLWSAGVVLHRLLSRSTPFPTGSLQELFAAVQNAAAAPLPATVPAALHDLVGALLQKDPMERPPSAASVLARLAKGTMGERARTDAPAVASKPARPSLSPLFGRDEELQILRRHIDSLATGAGELVLLSGDVGVGKSALLSHVAAQARESGAAVLDAEATELDGLLGPLHEACRRTLAVEGGLSIGAEARAAIELDRSRSGPAPDISMEQMGWALERFLAALSERSPVVVLVDNVHVARSEEVVVLRELARALHERPVLLLVSCLAAGMETSASATRGLAGFRELAALEGVVHVTLERLAPEALLQLLHDRNEGLRLEPDVARRVVETAEGNPLLGLELLRHLQDTGQVLLEGSTLRTSGDWGAGTLPQRVHDVVARRLEGLDDDARSLIDAAAVDGRVFDGAAVQSVVDRPLLAVLRGLQRLYRERRLVEPDGDAFRFGSRVVHEVIYSQVAPALRKALHERLAEYYEQSDQAIDSERLAIHWERAGDPDRARPHLLRAAHGARQRQDNTHAVELFARAGLQPDPIPEDWIRDDPQSVLVLCRSLARLGQSDSARALAAALSERGGDATIRDAAGVEHAEIVYDVSGPAGVDVELLARVGNGPEPSLARGEALYLQGGIAKHHGNLDEARAFLQRAENDFAALNLALERESAMQQMAAVALRAGQFDEAESMFEEAASLARAAGRRASAVTSEVNATLARVERGELDGAEARLTRAEHEFQLLASPQAVHTAVLLAQLYYSLGKIDDASAALARAGERIGVGRLVMAADLRECEAQIAWARGELTVATECVDAAFQLGLQAGSQSTQDRCARFRLGILLCLGERDRAGEQAAAMPSGPAAELWEEVAELFPLDPPLDALPGGDEANNREWIVALDALATGSPDPEALRPLRDRLATRPSPWQRAASRQVVHALDYAMRESTGGSGLEDARSGLRAAEQAGHVWWEAYWLRVLARVAGDAYYEERLDELLVRIARALPDATAQRKLMVAWAPLS